MAANPPLPVVTDHPSSDNRLRCIKGLCDISSMAWAISAIYSIMPALAGFMIVGGFKDSQDTWSQPIIDFWIGSLAFAVISLIAFLMIYRLAKRSAYFLLIPFGHAILNLAVIYGFAWKYRAVAFCAVSERWTHCVSGDWHTTAPLTLLYDFLMGIMLVALARGESRQLHYEG